MAIDPLVQGPDLRRFFLPALVAAAFFFGGLFLWSLLAPLERAAVVQGEVGGIGSQKQVEHLEGGLVSAILVQEGDRVVAGQVLIRLDRIQPEAQLSLIRSRYHALAALQARLIAERAGSEDIRFPESLLEAGVPQLAEILAGQRNIFAARREALTTKRTIYQQRIAQYRAEISGLEAAIRAQGQELKLLQDEVNAYQTLEDRGMSAGKIRMMAAQRNYARVQAEQSQNHAQLARAHQSVAEMEVRINGLVTDQLNEVVEQLRETENALFEVHERYRAAQDVLRRTDVRAPISGTVVGLAVHTVGSVIAPGEQLLALIPLEQPRIIEARLDPDDIDVVRPGLPAYVRFTAFSSRVHKPLSARVQTVSADRFTDARTGVPFYQVQVMLTGELDPRLGEELLYPGMQAEVMIVTGSQTPLDYLLEPLTLSLRRAFREH